MNTIGTDTTTVLSAVWRNKYRQASLDKLMRAGLVAEKICSVDRTNNRHIQNPYGSQPTTTQQAITGTYSTAAFTLTDDTLDVTEEFVVAEHILDFENSLNNFDVFANRVDEQNYSLMTAVDKYVLNALGTDGTGAYTTPVGGFTTAANINIIMSNLLSKVLGYNEVMNGLYLVIEATDVPGFIQAGATNGFNFADTILKNGWMATWMGVDIYVKLSGTFVTTTLGSKSVTMSGCRIFGVKNVTTFAFPRGVVSEELIVTTKTGREERTFCYAGFKAWATKAAMTVKITLA